MAAKLTAIQAEILARLTMDWLPEWKLVERNQRNSVALWDLVESGHAEQRPDRGFGYDYRLAQKGEDA